MTAFINNTVKQAQRQAAVVIAPMFINTPRKHDNDANALLEIWKN